MKKIIKLFTSKLDSFQESRFIFAQLSKTQVQSLQKAADSINEKNSEELQGKKEAIKELTKKSLVSEFPISPNIYIISYLYNLVSLNSKIFLS